MLITDKEKQQRKELKTLLESKSSFFDDKNGNKHKCLTVIDVMKILLEDKEIIAMSESIKKLEWLRNDMLRDEIINPDAGLVESFRKCGSLGMESTISEQSKNKI